jgi:uncharacterized membrane protein
MTDRKLELIVGNLLRVGVTLAALVVLGGGCWYLAASGGSPVDYRHFHPRAQPWLSLDGVPLPDAMIQVGLLILIATPIARVAFALAAFYLERDRLYAGITLAVLLVLLYSIATTWL